MELTERVNKLEIGYVQHDGRIKTLEDRGKRSEDTLEELKTFMIESRAEQVGRDKTLKKFMSVLTAISILSPVIVILVNYMVK